MMRLILFLALLLTLPAHARPATLTGQWTERGFQIAWQADAPTCLLLDGALLDCGDSGDRTLPRGGVDLAYAPIPGRQLALVDAERISDPPLATLAIPAEVRRVWLPVARA